MAKKTTTAKPAPKKAAVTEEKEVKKPKAVAKTPVKAAKPVAKAAEPKPVAKKAEPKAKTPVKTPAKAAPAVKAPAPKKAEKPAEKKVVAEKPAPAKKVAAVPAPPVKAAPVKVKAAKKAEPVAEKPVVQPEPAAEKPAVKVVDPTKMMDSKPIVTEVRYSQEDLDYFRNLIIEKQSEALNNLQALRDQIMDPSTGEYINENSPYSLHMADQGTDAMEKEKTYFYAQREQKFLSYLDEALKRVDNGTYGLCIECIEEPKNLCPTCPLIPKARLEAVPHSQLCAQIKKMQEKPRR